MLMKGLKLKEPPLIQQLMMSPEVGPEEVWVMKIW